MSRFETFLNGVRVLSTQLGGDALLKRPATDFDRPTQVHTGKAESEWLGSLLLELSADCGEWHGVPWRMLRNTFMRYGLVQRLLHATEKVPSTFFEEEPEVTWTFGGGRPQETLLIGLKDMLEKGLAIRTDIKGEAYFFPTDRLLSCAVTQQQPMTILRHLFPFGMHEIGSEPSNASEE